MTLEELYRSVELQLPITHNAIDYIDLLKRKLHAFRNLIDNLSTSEYRCEKIRKSLNQIDGCCSYLIDCLRYYYKGSPSAAFAELDKAIQSVKPSFDSLCIKGIRSEGLGQLYRLRVASARNLQKQDLFHVPFEKRGFVLNQRYSIAGLPCLYLGSSLYVCWEELNRPEFNSLQISRFKIDTGKKISIVDFGILPRVIFESFDKNSSRFKYKKQFEDYVESVSIAKTICWPIICACSIRARQPEATFKPEYIIPQLLSEWIANKKGYDGIRYFSMALPSYSLNNELILNYVFPVRTRNPKGYCRRLSRLFKMTEPISWGLAQSLARDYHITGPYEYQFNVVPGFRSTYSETEFGKIQMFIDSLPIDYLGM